MMVLHRHLICRGTWTGYLTQANAPYYFKMTLQLNQIDKFISGTSKFETADGSGTYALYQVKGRVLSDRFIWQDEVLINQYSANPRWVWAKKYVQNTVSKVGDSLILECFYWSNPDGYVYNQSELQQNSSLQFYIKSIRASKLYAEESSPSLRDVPLLPPPAVITPQQKPAPISQPASNPFVERKIKVFQTFEVASDSLELNFYDNGEIDGDSITVFYNNELQMEKKRVSNEALILKVAVESNKDNLLVIHALNLGLIPPNTATLLFRDNGIRKIVNISSNKTLSGAIIFRRKR